MSLIFNPTPLYMLPNNQAVDVSKDVQFSFIFQGYELNSARLNLYRQNTSGKWVTINNDWYDFTLGGTKYNGDVVSSEFNLTNMLDYYGSNLGWRLEVYGYELTCNQDTQTPDDNSFPYNASGIETGDAFSFNVDGVRTLYYINIFSGNRMRFYTNREAALQNSNLNVVSYNKISGKIGKAYGVSPLVPLVLIIPPLLKLNVPSPITVPNYEFVPTWQYFGATQTIVIKHWKATLYNDSGKEIDTSGDVYNGNLKYTFQTLLLSDNNYKVEYEVYDNNGYYYSTGLVDVKVFYETATSNFVPTLEVDCYDTSMKVDWSGAHNVRGVLSKGEPEYLDDYIVDGNYGLRLPKDVSLTYNVDMPQNQMPTFVWEPGSVNYDGEIVRFTSDTQELIVSYNNSTKTLYYTLNIKGTSYSYRSNISTEFSLKDKGTYLIGFYGNNGYIREVQTNQYIWSNVEGYVLQPTLAKQRSLEQMVVEGNVEKHEPTTYQAYVTPDNPLQLVSNVNPNTSNNHGALPTSETKQNLFTPWINKYAEGVSEAPTTIPCRNTEYNWFSRKGIFVNIMIDPSLGYVLGYHRFLTPIPQGKKIYVHFGSGGQPYSVRMYFTNDERTLKELYRASDDVGEAYDGSFTNSENYKYFVMDFTPQNSLNSMTISDVYVGLDEWDSEANYLPPFKDICVELATIGTTNIKVLGQANISCKDLTFSNYIETPNTEAYNQVLFTHPQITSIMYHINNEYCEYPLLSNMFENIFYASQKPKQDYPFTIAKSVKYRSLNVNALTLSFPKTFGDLDSIASYIKNNKNTNLQLIYPRKIENVEYQRTNDNKNTKDVGQTFRPSAYPSIFNVGDVVFPQNTLKIINSGRNTFDVSKHQGSSTSWDVSQQAYSHDGNAIVDMEDMWNLYKTIDKPMHLTFDAKMNVDGNLMISSCGSKEKQFVGTDVIRVGQNYQRFNVKIDKFTKRNDEGLNNGSELLFSDKDSIDVARINTPNGEENLFDYTKFNTQTLNGVTITNLNNGVFKIDGTPTSNNVVFPYWNISHDEFVKMFKPGMLILKGQTTNPSLFVQIFKSDSLIARVVLRDGMIDTNDSIVISSAWLSDASVTARMLFSYANTSSFKGGFTRPILYQPNSQKPSITKNLFDKNDVIKGIRADANGLVDATNAQTSNYIEVQPNTQYYLTNVIGLSTWFTGGYFDKDKKFISQLNVSGRFPTSGAITTPSNCYYIVLNILVNNNLVDVNQVMMSLGSTPIDYEPFETIEVVDYEIVDDDMTYPQISMNVDGDYEQVTTQGYQLFDASKLPTKSQGGATVMNNGDGSFTISGSGNLTDFFSIVYQYSHEETLKLLKVGDINLVNGNSTTPFALVQLVKADGASTWFVLNKDIAKATITQEMLNDERCVLQIYIFGEKNSAIQAGTIKPMLYQDGDGTWEPFTGGEPSPNPSYAQEPKFIGDIGQNLFDASRLPTKSQGGATVTNNGDGSFTISGSGKTSDSYANSFESALNVTLKEGTIYLKNVGNITNPYLSIEFKNSDGGVIKRLSLQGVEQSSASLTSDDVSKIQIVRYAIYTPASTTIQTGTIKPMLYQDGDGTYRPYSETSKYYLDVNAQSDNLLNGDYFYNYGLNYLIQNSSTALNAISKKQYRGRNCLYVNATSPILRDCQFLKNRFKPNTRYYINITMLSYDASKPNQTGLYVRVIYTDGTRLLIGVPNEDRFNSTFVSSDPNKSISYIDLSYAYHSIGYIDLDNSFICEEAIYKKSIIDNASIDLDQPLRAFPNGVRDYITQDDKVIRNVGEITYDGSEAWSKNASSDPSNWMYYTNTSHTTSNGNALCNSLIHKAINDLNQGSKLDNVGFNSYYNANVIYVNVGYYMEQAGLTNTVENLRTWLQSNPITVWYELAAPTTNELTDEQKQQWHSLQRFSDKTHIYGNFKTSMIEYNQGLKSGALPKVSVKNISMSTDADILYEPYNAQKINVANIQLNKLYNDNELSSSGIFDSVDLEKALFTQYIKLTSFTTPTSIVSGIGVDYVVIPKPSDYSGYGNTTKGAVMGDSFRSSNSTTLIDYEEFVLYTRYNSNSFYLSVPKGMNMDLIKNYLLNRQYYYTLTNPITLNIGSKLGQQWEDFKLNAGMNTIYDDSDNGVYPYLYLTYRDSAQTS